MVTLLDLMVEAIGFGVGVHPVVLFGLRVVCVRTVDCLGFLFSLRWVLIAVVVWWLCA